jgi:IS30 family transposase
MKKIAEIVKERIKTMLKQHLTAKEVAERVGISVRTVSTIRKEIPLWVPLRTRGRGRIFSPARKRWLARQIISGRHHTATSLAKEVSHTLKMTVSDQTVRNALRDSGLKSAVRKKGHCYRNDIEPRATNLHENTKIGLLKTGSRLFFSDETKINRLWSDGRKWTWRRPGDPLSDRDVGQ